MDLPFLLRHSHYAVQPMANLRILFQKAPIGLIGRRLALAHPLRRGGFEIRLRHRH